MLVNIILFTLILIVCLACGKDTEVTTQTVNRDVIVEKLVEAEYENTYTPCKSNKGFKEYVLKLTNGDMYIWDQKKKVFLDVTNYVQWDEKEGCYNEL